MQKGYRLNEDIQMVILDPCFVLFFKMLEFEEERSNTTFIKEISSVTVCSIV